MEVVPFVQHLDIRMAGDARPLGGGTEPVLTAWLRLKEPAFSPAETALVLLDSMPPALYAATTEPVVAPGRHSARHRPADAPDPHTSLIDLSGPLAPGCSTSIGP